MPIPLGILAVAGASAAAAGSYEHIVTVNGTGSSGTITFSNVDQTYKHLQLRYVAKTTDSGNGNLNIQITPYGTGTFSSHTLRGDGSAVQSVATANQNQIVIPDGVAVSLTADGFSAGIVDFLDYANTSKNKTIRMLQGHRADYQRIQLHSGLSASTNAMTEFKLVLAAGNFNSASRFSLYGIK